MVVRTISRSLPVWTSILLLVGPAFSVPPIRAIPFELADGMRLSLAFEGIENNTLNFTGRTELRITINASSSDNQSISYSYFGSWIIQSYLGVEPGGSLSGSSPGGKTTETIVVDEFAPRIGVILVTVAAVSGASWAANQTSLMVYRDEISFGTFFIDVAIVPATEYGAGLYFVTSHSTFPMVGDLANITLVYFSLDGQFLPNLGFSDDDGHDRVLFMPLLCSDKVPVIWVLGTHPNYGVALNLKELPTANEDCMKSKAAAATVVIQSIQKENETSLFVTLKIKIELPAPPGIWNATFWFIPEHGSTANASYQGDLEWVVGYRTPVQPWASRFLLVGSANEIRFVLLVLASDDIDLPAIFHKPVKEAFAQTSIQVESNVTDLSGPPQVFLHYSTNGGATYLVTPMQREDQNRYTGTIPPQPLGTALCYYIEAIDRHGKAAREPDPGCVEVVLVPVSSEFAISGLAVWGVIGLIAALIVMLAVAVLLRRSGGGGSSSVSQEEPPQPPEEPW